MQRGEVSRQNMMHISLYSHKLIPEKIYYATTERKILSIVYTLKYFHIIILVHRIKVYRDHKNIMYDNLTM